MRPTIGWSGNLAVLVRAADPDLAVTPSDVDASGFWISNPDNTVNRNVAAGAEFAGFWLGFPEHPLGDSASDDIFPRRTPLRSFRSNTAHTVGFAGLYLDGGEDENRQTVTTWYEPRLDPADPDSPHVTPVIDRFTAYKSRHYGFWLRTFVACGWCVPSSWTTGDPSTWRTSPRAPTTRTSEW